MILSYALTITPKILKYLENTLIIGLTYSLLPDNHSLLFMVDSHNTFVGGNKSSWKYAVFTLGTVNEIGSIVLFVKRKALANSTSRTLHTCLERKANP